MSLISQHIHGTFPDEAETISGLKVGNVHFLALATEFNVLDEEATRIDAGLEPASDVRLEALKKQRLALLDDIAPLISAEKDM